MNKFSSDPPLESSTLLELLRRRALHHPERRAFTFLIDGELEGDRLTYRDLDRRARAVGALLQQYAAPGERALLVYPPGIEFITAFFGCLYSGVIAVPTYPPQTRTKRSLTKLRAIVNDVQPTVALITSSVSSMVESLFAQAPELQATRLVATDHIDDNLADLWQDPGVNGDTLAFFQYTSGSTGMPKGVMLTHSNLMHNLDLIYQTFDLNSDSHGMIWLPLYHDMGLIGGILGACYCGGQSTVMSPVAFLQRPIRWLQAISNSRATNSGGPDFAYDLCVRKITPEQKAGLDLSSWEIAFNGAEPIRKETLERFAEAFAPYGFRREAFFPCYGLAEGTLIVSGGQKVTIPVVRQFQVAPLEQNQVVMADDSIENGSARALVGCGRPVPDQKVVIVNPEPLTPCLPDQIGEVWVSSPCVAQGYWQKPEETERTFRGYLADTGEGPFLRTGDLGFLQDGELFVTGRLKDLIIIRGRNHYPHDIELTVEQSHPALRSGCGVAFSVDELNEERLVIVQEVERQYRDLNVDEVVETIRHAVAEEHELQVYAVVLIRTSSIPKTSSGKRQRRACREGFLARKLDVVAEWSLPLGDGKLQPIAVESDVDEQVAWQKKPLDPDDRTADGIQTWLVAQLSEQLKIPHQNIDVREPLVHYGMDSLQAVSLAADLEGWLGRTLPPTLAYDYPTIEALAHYLAGEDVLEAGSRGAAPGSSLKTGRELPYKPENNGHLWNKQTNQGNTRIESLGTYLPASIVSTTDILRACKQQVLFPLEDFTGIKSRRTVGEGEFSIDLARKAIEDCLASSRYHPADIDILICCNCSRCDGPDYQVSFEPGTSIKLKKYFGFDNALVFDITNACAGMFTGVYIVDALIKAGLIRRGMVASGEYITHLTDTAQKEIDNYMDPRLACLTLGDAGAAIILDASPDNQVGFHEIDMYTLGCYSPYCIAGPTEEEHGGAIMFTEMGKLTAAGIKQSVAHVFHVLEQLQQPVDAFQHIIPHQTSRISLDEVARETNRLHNREVCSDRNIIYNLTERGNTASTSHFVALKDNIVNNRIASGENVIFSITASGLNVGTALYTLDDLPDRLRRTLLDGQEPQKLPSTRKIEPLIPPADSPRVRIESVGTIPGKVKRNTEALVEAAVGDCLARSSYNRSDIELLIHAGTYHTDFIAEPAMAAIVAGNLKINGDIESQSDKKTFAFDLLNGAIGFLNACYAASGMIKAKKFKNAMIVASEIENNVEVPAKELRCLKETSSVVILEESAGGKEGFGNFVFKYFTDYLDTFAAYAVQERGKTYVHFKNDPNIEHYYLKCINETIGELLELEKLAISSIKVIFPPQISSAFISRLSSEMNVCREKFVDIAHDGKDYFTSSLPYALQHAREQQLVKAGDIGLIINVGTGIQVGCATYYF